MTQFSGLFVQVTKIIFVLILKCQEANFHFIFIALLKHKNTLFIHKSNPYTTKYVNKVLKKRYIVA